MTNGQLTLVTADVAAQYVRDYLDRPCTEATVRKWAQRYPTEFPYRGWDGPRRLFALEDIHAHATKPHDHGHT